MSMIKTWRWFGEHDNVTFSDIKQAGVKNLVTSLFHVPYGEIWTKEDILWHKQLIEDNDLEWLVVESVPVHEDIKTRTGNYLQYIQNYKKSIENLGESGIKTVCYNFMPIMDWTRTDIDYKLDNGAHTLRFEKVALIAFDLFILNRTQAEDDYTHVEIAEARAYFEKLLDKEVEELTNLFIANLPGTDEKYTLEEFGELLKKYEHIDTKKLKEHLYLFLEEIIPVAEKAGIQMCIHPDDPPYSLLGLPRIVSNEKDIDDLLSSVDSPNNGLTFCTGSLGVRPDNDLPSMFTRFADKVHFIHLRSTQRDEKGNFHEANHLEGDVDMYAVIKNILIEQERRKKADREDYAIPMRPDHGFQMMDDVGKEYYPGYSLIGRMKGLAELTGLEYGIIQSLDLES
ncbi:MAG: mannonate dehydratase [Bacteroidota bacterium]